MAIIQTKQTNIYLIYLVLQGVHLLINKVFFLYWTDKIKISNYEISQFLIFSAVLLAMLFVVIVYNLQTCVKKVYWYRSLFIECKSRYSGVGKVSLYCYKVTIYVLSIITAKSTVKGLFIWGHVVVLTPSSMHRNRSMLEKPRVLWIPSRFENPLIQ